MKCDRRINIDGNVIILDQNISEANRSELQNLELRSMNEFILLDADNMQQSLESLVLSAHLPLDENTLFVFPGNGGNMLRQYSKIHLCNTIAEVFAKRVWYEGCDPFVLVGEIPSASFMCLNVKIIFVLDDVISSGQTIEGIFRRNSWKFPNAKWFAGSWISRGYKIKNYVEVFSSCIVQHTKALAKKVPINSLSTLVKDVGIAKSYARRNIKYPEKFLEIMKSIHYQAKNF